MRKITITFGLISGAIVFVYSFATFMIFGDFLHMSLRDLKIVETLGYLRYIILLLTIFFAMKTFKKQLKGEVKYWQMVRQGFMVALVVAVCIGIMECVYILFNPGFYENYGRLYAEQLKVNGASPKEISSMSQEMDKYKWMQNPALTGLFYFFETIVIGGVASLIFGKFFKTKHADRSVG